MQFRYKEFPLQHGPGIARPVIQVVLRNLRDQSIIPIAYEALVDSGSDRCIFPGQIAELLGIDLKATKHWHYVGGVVAGERRPVYFHPVEMELGGLGGPAFMTSVGFMPDFSQSGHGLLGRKGFFDEFTFVKFKDAEHILDIGKRRR